jgi:hypothetical protein
MGGMRKPSYSIFNGLFSVYKPGVYFITGKSREKTFYISASINHNAAFTREYRFVE